MNLPDELKFLEKPISFFKFEVTPESMLRCVLWTLLFLGLAHYHAPKLSPQMPYAKEMTAQNLTPLSTAASDPRWSRNDLTPLPENSIAWIGGSSYAIKPTENADYTFLPSEVKTDFDLYVSIKMARRMLDTYTMVKDAIARKPEGMIITLNSFWDLQDGSAFFKTNLMNKGTSTWLNAQDWTLIPLLSSPSNILWATIGQKHNLIGNSYDYLKAMQLKYARPIQKNKTEANEEQKSFYSQPVLFWTMNRYNKGKNFENFDAAAWQEEVMARNNVEQSQWGQRLLKNMLVSIKKSNIPTIIYLAPINPKLEQTPVRVAYRTIDAQIAQIIKDYENTNIHYVTVPKSVVDSMIYVDYLHLSNSGRFPTFLSKQISDMMEKHEK